MMPRIDRTGHSNRPKIDSTNASVALEFVGGDHMGGGYCGGW